MATQDDIENWFTFHPVASDQQRASYQEIRDYGKEFARVVSFDVPKGTELDEAIKHIRAAVMWANAGIACNGSPPVSRTPLPPSPGANEGFLPNTYSEPFDNK